MDQAADIQMVADRLRSVRDALESERFEKALEGLIGVRESGELDGEEVAGATVDEQVDRLRKEPTEETASAIADWAAEALDELGTDPPDTDDDDDDGDDLLAASDPFANLEEVSEVGKEISAEEVLPMSESSDVGVELRDASEVDDQHTSRGEFDDGDEDGSATAVGVDSLTDGSDSADGTTSGDEQSGDFEGLPSMQMEIDEETELEDDEELEPMESDGDSDRGEALLSDGDEIEVLSADAFESDGDGSVEEVSEGDVVADVFGGDASDKNEGSLFEEEPAPEGNDGSVSEGSSVDDEKIADDDDLDSSEGFEFDSDSSAEWSALSAFESSELEADSSDFEFDEDQEAPEDEQAAGPDPDDSAQPALAGNEPASEPAVEEAGGGDDDLGLDFEFDEDEDSEVLADGGETSASGSGREEVIDEANRTQQPFDTKDQAEHFAQASLEDEESEPASAGSVEELVGEENADLLRNGDGESSSQPESDSGDFTDDELTAQNVMPKHIEDEESEADDSDDFDLGFENPGADDAASFDFNQEEEAPSDSTSTPTPVPDDAPSPAPSQTPMPDEAPSPSPTDQSASTPMPDQDQASNQPRAHGEGEEPKTGEVEQPDPEMLQSMEPDSEPDGTRQGFNPFAAEDEEPTSQQQPASDGGMGGESTGARYVAEDPSAPGAADDAEEPAAARQGGLDEPLSDDEFFELADELSDSETTDSAEDSDAATPMPHRGEPVVPSDDGDSQSSGESLSTSDDAPSMSGIREPSGPGKQQPGGSSGVQGAHSHVSHASSEAKEESRELTSGAVRLINEAESLFEQGNLESAHDLVQSVLDGNADSERAQKLLERIEEEYETLDSDEDAASEDRETVESDQPPPMDAVPQREVDMSEVADRDFDHRFGFILSLVDGTVTVQDILELSSMSRQETLSVLSSMIDQSILSIDQ